MHLVHERPSRRVPSTRCLPILLTHSVSYRSVPDCLQYPKKLANFPKPTPRAEACLAPRFMKPLARWKPTATTLRGFAQLEDMSMTALNHRYLQHIAASPILRLLAYYLSQPVSTFLNLSPHSAANNRRHLLNQLLRRQSSRCYGSQCSRWSSCLLWGNLPIHQWHHGDDQRQHLWRDSISLLRGFQSSLCDDIYSGVRHSRSIHGQNHRTAYPGVFTSIGYLALGVVHPDCHIHRCRNAKQLDTICGLGCTQRRVAVASCWLHDE